MTTNRVISKKNRIRKRRRRIFKWVLLPFMVLILSGTAYGAFLYSKAESVMDDSYQPVERETTREVAVDPVEDSTSILFIGVDDSDARDYNSSSRSDALMLATLNREEKSIKLVSIPRDSYVYVPELGYKDKITHAHANGGVKSTIETVEGFLDIPVDYYVKMNFNAFIDVIDAFGGIEVEVPYALNEKDSKDRHNAIRLQPGLQELDGEEALALARTRKLDNDIERGKRQQEIIKAIMKKAVNVQSLAKYDDVIQAVGNNMSTDISFKEMKSFVNYATAGTGLDIETITLAGYDDYVGPKYVYAIDEEALDETIQKLQVHLQLIEESKAGTTTEGYVKEDSEDDSVNY